MDKLALTKAFNQLQKTRPELGLGKSVLVGNGVFGAVADNRDGTVTKLMLRQNRADFQANAETVLHNEVSVLRLLNGDPIGTVQVPALLGPPVQLTDQDFFSAYRMTKVPGVAANWNWKTEFESENAARDETHFTQAGTLLAQFHKKLATLDLDKAGLKPTRIWAEHIDPFANMDADINNAFAKINVYYAANKRAKAIHGDFHGGNILTDAHGNIQSLIDFAETKRTDNFMVDMVNIPSAAFPHFQKAYESESGDSIDPLMVTMVAIHGNTAYLRYLDESGSADMEARNKALNTLYDNMSAVKSVTGYTPPGF